MKLRQMTCGGFLILMVASLAVAFPPDQIKSSAAFNAKVLEATRPAVVEFYIPNCKNCKSLDPVLRWLMNKYEGRVDFYRINIRTEFGKGRAGKYDASTYPTVMLFDDGKTCRRWVKTYSRGSYCESIDKALN